MANSGRRLVLEFLSVGEIRNFPGVSAKYDVPENPDLVVETDKHSMAESVEQIVTLLKEKKIIL